MRAGRYSSPDYDAGPAARAERQRTMAGPLLCAGCPLPAFHRAGPLLWELRPHEDKASLSDGRCTNIAAEFNPPTALREHGRAI